MDAIWESILNGLHRILVEGVIANLSGMFDYVNEQVGDIAAQVGTTPSAWNAGIYNMVRNLSETVILPIAGVILAFVMTLELIQMVADKNSMHDVDTWMLGFSDPKSTIPVMTMRHTICSISWRKSSEKPQTG